MRASALLGVCIPLSMIATPLPARSPSLSQPTAWAASSRSSSKWESCMTSPVQKVSPSLEQVLAAQLDGVDAEPVGHHVDDPLGGPHGLHGAVAAERAAGRQVGVDAVGVDRDVVEAVRPDAGVAHLLRDARARSRRRRRC